jgi:hypothetical protein
VFLFFSIVFYRYGTAIIAHRQDVVHQTLTLKLPVAECEKRKIAWSNLAE